MAVHERHSRLHKLFEEFRKAHRIFFVFMIDGIAKLAEFFLHRSRLDDPKFLHV